MKKLIGPYYVGNAWNGDANPGLVAYNRFGDPVLLFTLGGEDYRRSYLFWPLWVKL